MHSHRQGIEEALTTTKGQLEKLHTDIGRTLEKISSREKYLNNQLEAPLADFKRLSDTLAAAREQYRSVSGGKYDIPTLFGTIYHTCLTLSVTIASVCHQSHTYVKQ